MNKYRLRKHFGLESPMGRAIQFHGDEARQRPVAERARRMKVPPPPQFERRNYPEHKSR